MADPKRAGKYKEANRRAVHAFNRRCRENPDSESGRKFKERRRNWRHTPKGKAMRRREHETMMADPVKAERHRTLVRRSTNAYNAIRRLMRDLSGIILPRPYCSNECQTSHYDAGKPKAPHRQKWCVWCSVITNDTICMCCFKKTRNLHNVAAYKRERWEVALGADLAIMLGQMLGAAECDAHVPQGYTAEAPAREHCIWCYYCGRAGESVCGECRAKLHAELDDGDDEYGSDKAFYARHRHASKRRGGVKKVGREREGDSHRAAVEHDRTPAEIERRTSRRAAISKRNAYASPPPTSEGLKDADKKYDAIARAKERKERKPSEVVDAL